MEPAVKRRRVRKGTHSCWECKRRKVRCILAASTDTTCISCKRRDLPCVSQDLEPPSRPESSGNGSKRLDRFEILLHELSEKVKGGGSVSLRKEFDLEAITPTALVDFPTPSSTRATPRVSSNLEETLFAAKLTHVKDGGTPSTSSRTAQQSTPQGRPAPTNRLERISARLLSALPSRHEIARIENLIPAYAWVCFKTNFVSRTVLQQELSREPILNDSDRSGLLSCEITDHPVLIASKMLKLASGMLYIPRHQYPSDLQEPYELTRARLIETAIRLVTTDDSLLNSIGGLECVLREGLSHLEVGNLRRGWTTFRRATTIGQLLGLQRTPCPPRESLGVGNGYDPQAIWFRVVWIDRFVSIMLGLPHSNSQIDESWGDGWQSAASSEHLERKHAHIAGQILERNQMGFSQATLDKTMELDRELIKAAQALPETFWRSASCKAVSDLTFEDCLNNRDQVIHYSLLNQLHLPFLFCPNVSTSTQASYSKSTCMTASREILTRVTAFRTFNATTACCRTSEFLALIAAMTLMLAHIESHCRAPHTNILIHQRLSDRGVVEQALEAMQEIFRLSKDVWARKCANVLRHLLHVEADAARGQRYSAEKVGGGGAGGGGASTSGDEDALYITLPYFPTIRIARQGFGATTTTQGSTVRKETSSSDESITLGGLGSLQVGGEVSAQSSVGPSREACQGTVQVSGCGKMGIQSGGEMSKSFDASDPTFGNVSSDQFPEYGFNGLVDGGGDFSDWALQGVDLAFLDNLTWTMGT